MAKKHCREDGDQGYCEVDRPQAAHGNFMNYNRTDRESAESLIDLFNLKNQVLL